MSNFLENMAIILVVLFFIGLLVFSVAWEFGKAIAIWKYIFG